MGSTDSKEKQKLHAISHFAGRVVHDLNNFSTIVVSVVELLKEDLAGNEEGLQKLVMVEDAGERLMECAQGLNRFRFQRMPEQSGGSVDDLIAQVVDQHEHKERIDFDKGVGNSGANISDEGLKQTITTMIDNGITASGDDGRVSIVTKAGDNNQIIITVSDQGCGMDEDMLSCLGNPFFSSNDRIKGAGVNLSDAYFSVFGCDGNIEVESKPNQGTKFTITLGAAQATANS